VRAWRAHELGEPGDVLRLEEVDEPAGGDGSVVVTVEACGVNFPDVLQLRGQYQEKPPLPFTPGMELAGTTDDGRRVMCLFRGGLAERVAVPEAALRPLPETMPADEATALLVNYQTTHVALHRRANLRAGEVLLVHAAAGGVGSSAVQLGKAAGATVIGTAGGPDKVQVVEQLGADVAIDYTAQDFVEIVKEVTGGRGADVVYDPVGGDVFDRSRRCTAWEGRILVIGFTSGRIPDAPANHVLLKNYSVVGVHWAAYNLRDPQLLAEVHDDLLRLHAEGAIEPLVGDRVPFTSAPDALAAIADGRTVGKVVVVPS
jgi:NADPH2:quinone reductase